MHRRTLRVFGLVAALLMAAAAPATAAPDNRNNAENVIPLECDAPIGDITVRTAPGQGLPAWDLDTGEIYVAKQFVSSDEVTVQIVDGDSVSATFEGIDDRGGAAPAQGRDLVACEATFEFEDGPFPIDAGFAEELNTAFATDIFADGQIVTISGFSTFTVLVLAPGR